MKKNYLMMWLMALMMVTPLITLGQITVTGKVVDASSGESLPGVSVTIRGTTQGTATDINGNFSISVSNSNAQLVFSFVGYSQQIVSASSSPLNIRLREDIARLEEVVITGLASNVKRSNLANAVATVSGSQLTGVTNPQTLDGALSGKVPGANIVSSSGAPGGGFSVRLRGLTSVNSNTQPLYVVDGVFLDNSAVPSGINAVTRASGQGNSSNQDNASNRIADINPDDIESIEILKGASAAAIYGALASSGVIIITTKKGKAGVTKVNVNQDFGFSQISKRLGMRTFTEQRVMDTYGPSAVPIFQQAQAANRFIDYEDEVYGNNGLIATTNVSLSGGNDKTTFFISGLFSDEEGIIKNTGYDKTSIRANIGHKISDKISLDISSNYINSSADRGLTNNDNQGVTFGVALSSTPNFVDLRPDAAGNYPRNPFAASNPLETRDLITNNEKTNRFLGSIALTSFIQQSSKSITKVVARGGFDFYNLKTTAIFPRALQFQSGGSGTNGASIQGNTNNLNFNGVISLGNVFYTGKVNLTSTLGATFENFDRETILNVATQLIGSQTNINQAAALTSDQILIPRRNRGLFIQEEFNYDDKFIATAGLRLDKSSDNADVNEYQLFPKASLAVNLNNFGFWTSEKINQLKLRVAYGESGNFPNFGSKFTNLLNSNIGGQGGLLISPQQGNDKIKQERQKEFETGFDLGILNNRISLEATYYQKNGTDLIFASNVPTSSGFTTKIINGGTLRNRGVELGLTVDAVNNPNFKWITRTSFWKNKSVVTQLDVPAFNLGGFGNTLGTFRIEEGKEATLIYGIDGPNGVSVLGNAEPKFQMNFSNDFVIAKNLTFNFQFHWKHKFDNINLTELLTDLGGTSPDYDADANGNGTPDAIDRINTLGVTARTFVQDATYVRLREAGLYYNLSAKALSSMFGNKVSSMKIGVSGNNLFTFTNYKSYDPEVSNFGGQGFSTGVEVTPFPQSRRMFFHISLGF